MESEMFFDVFDGIIEYGHAVSIRFVLHPAWKRKYAA
jgi:hypothetical protein